MNKFLLLFILLNIYNFSNASVKDNIILQLKKTENLSFYFKQIINENNEVGSCVIKYPKKIYCEYKNLNNKIIVSNGKSLVIKNKKDGKFWLYPLKKTPLEFLLDKDYLIKKINALEYRDVGNKYLNFKITEKDNEINIFFDKKTFVLTGWQIEDVYQNLSITFISSVAINTRINENIFILPKLD